MNTEMPERLRWRRILVWLVVGVAFAALAGWGVRGWASFTSAMVAVAFGCIAGRLSVWREVDGATREMAEALGIDPDGDR